MHFTGFLGPIADLLFLLLSFIHTHIAGNWGWSIVILTLLINTVLLPLRIKTMQSSLRMQKIQPEMKAIRQRYQHLKLTDPKRTEMNAELMKLQKDNGVNLFGGCIPTLIQAPLLIAFYRMLPKVTELRHAPWLWISDLSAADPYHLLPILFALSILLSQRITPTPGVDPRQRRLMAFLIGFTAWSYGSGLALYGACSSLIGAAQQLAMNRAQRGETSSTPLTPPV